VPLYVIACRLLLPLRVTACQLSVPLHVIACQLVKPGSSWLVELGKRRYLGHSQSLIFVAKQQIYQAFFQ